MSSYTATIHCEKCGIILATIHAEHEDKSNWFVPQDILETEFKIRSMFCQNCLNREEADNDKVN